jgi:Protein kinase domain/PEGA domain
VLHQIGIGTLGPVFRTYEPIRDRLVAVKVFRLDIVPEQAQLLADALSRATESSLFHPSIVEPIASGVEGTLAYRAEEYVAAESLDVAMRHYAPAPTEKALPFITQLAGAIDFARAAGVGHGGLHPRDIFVTPDEARATGFGVVEALEQVGIRAPIRRPYSAPERIDGGKWGTPADVFSLAAITFELLTGRRPAGTGAQAGALPDGPRSAALHAVLARAMDDDPARRYASALAFAGALESAARGEPDTTAVWPVAALAAVPAALAAARPRQPPPSPPPPPEPEPEIEPGPEVRSEATPESPFALNLDAPRGGRTAAEPELHLTAEPTPAEFALDEVLDPAPTLFDEDEEEEVEQEGEDVETEVLPVVATGHFLDDFVEEGTVAEEATIAEEEDDVAAEEPVYAAEAPMFAAAEPDPVDPDVTERSGPTILPYAVTLVLGLLPGFAAGYFVGSRDRLTPTAAPPSVSVAPPAPAATGPATSEKPGQYSEQKVTAPPPIAAADAGAPSAVAPSAPARVRVPAPAPAPVDAPRPERIAGHLVVRSTPSRAAVTVNGTWRGRTPLTLDALPFGRYVVRVVLDGFNVAREEVSLTARDASYTVDARLEPKARGRASLRPTSPQPTPPPAPPQPVSTTGSIYVDSRPRGATVIVDGKTVGQTPLSLADVAPGGHVVRIEMAGKQSWTSLAKVAAGQVARVTGSLEDQR